MYKKDEAKEILGGTLIFIGFFITLIVCMFVSLNSGPLILGTEMNTNGLVEYLCLGSGCENLQDMDW